MKLRLHFLTFTAIVGMAATLLPYDAYAKRSSNDQKVTSWHRRAVDQALSGKTKLAIENLETLLKKDMDPGERDRVNISLGRVYYQAKKYPEALQAYSRVRTGYPSWFESLEEKAWTYMQMGKPDEALASLKTVMSPIFKDRDHSEPYFLTALAQLRVCDYPAIFKTISIFKDRFRDRVKTWESSKTSTHKKYLTEVHETIQKLNLVEAEAIQWVYVADENSSPRYAGRISKSGDKLSFPHTEDGEVWLDEIDNFRVSVRGCPTGMSQTQAANKGS